MKKLIRLILLLLPVSTFAANDTLLSRIYSESDIVAHIRIKNDPISYSTKDMGSEWCFPRFEVIRMYRQAVPLNDSSFIFEKSGYTPDTGYITPGKEYIVFLVDGLVKRNRTFMQGITVNSMILVPGCLYPYDVQLAAQLENFSMATAFDRAVTRGDWEKVQRLIEQQVKRSSKKSKGQAGPAEKEVLNWLNSHATVYKAIPDACAIHISIFPGWSDIGIRFLTEKGPVDYELTLQHGKVYRQGRIKRMLGSEASSNSLFFKSFRLSPGAVERIEKTCGDYEFNSLRNWKIQEEVEVRTEFISDTIPSFAMLSPVVRIKVGLYNKSDRTLNLLWPGEQNQGNKILYFNFVKDDGLRMEEEKILLMTPYEDHMASVRAVLPGDSLVSIHSINDPFVFFSDVRGHHDVSFLPEGNWAVSVVYKPEYDIDTVDYWKPAGGQREVFNEKLLVVNSAEMQQVTTPTVKMLSEFVYYKNSYGQQCAYAGLVQVLEAPQGSPFAAGDTIAYTFPLTFDRNPDAEPVYAYQFVNPGDVFTIDLNVSFPPDRFQLPGTGMIKNYLTTSDPETVKLLSK